MKRHSNPRSSRSLSNGRSRNQRAGFTLLELLIASSLMTVLVTTVAMLLRGGHEAWLAVEADHSRLQSAEGTLRHLVRQLRQADAVAAISPASSSSGSISVQINGVTHAWAHDPVTKRVNYGLNTPASLLAENIESLRFTGYQADTTTATTVPADVQLIRCEATVQLPRSSGGSRTLTSWVWVRSF